MMYEISEESSISLRNVNTIPFQSLSLYQILADGVRSSVENVVVMKPWCKVLWFLKERLSSLLLRSSDRSCRARSIEFWSAWSRKANFSGSGLHFCHCTCQLPNRLHGDTLLVDQNSHWQIQRPAVFASSYWCVWRKLDPALNAFECEKTWKGTKKGQFKCWSRRSHHFFIAVSAKSFSNRFNLLGYIHYSHCFYDQAHDCWYLHRYHIEIKLCFKSTLIRKS